MKKIRSFLAVIALAAALGGSFLPLSGIMANAASGQHAGPSAAGLSTRSVAYIHIYPPCPVVGTIDC